MKQTKQQRIKELEGSLSYCQEKCDGFKERINVLERELEEERNQSMQKTWTFVVQLMALVKYFPNEISKSFSEPRCDRPFQIDGGGVMSSRSSVEILLSDITYGISFLIARSGFETKDNSEHEPRTK